MFLNKRYVHADWAVPFARRATQVWRETAQQATVAVTGWCCTSHRWHAETMGIAKNDRSRTNDDRLASSRAQLARRTGDPH